MLLRELLKKENNNLDIFRVLAALLVIYGHAYAILPNPGRSDVIGRLLGFDYSGSLAVKVFFFLSGLVVTNSLMGKRNVFQFVISRTFRIWPAFIVVLMVSSLLLGSLFTSLPLGTYFMHEKMHDYVTHTGLMSVRYALPGVFEDMTRSAVNGSLWSIPYEVAAYIILLCLFLLRVLDVRPAATFVFLLILVDAALGNTILFTWLPDNAEVITLAPCFAFGALLALWKDRVTISISLCVGAWGLYWMLDASAFNYYFFYAAFFLSILYLSGLEMVIALKPKVDVSYGVYLWGWPTQQVFAYFFVDYGLRFNQLGAMIVALLLGWASWHLIEKRSMRFGSKLSRDLSGLMSKTSVEKYNTGSVQPGDQN